MIIILIYLVNLILMMNALIISFLIQNNQKLILALGVKSIIYLYPI